MSDNFWTDEKVSELIRLWEMGLSGSAVATVLGAESRCAVLGKLNRLRNAGHVFKRVEIKRDDSMRKRIARNASAAATAKVRARRPKASNNLAAVNAARKAERQAAKPFVVPEPTVIDVTQAKPWTERKFGECAYPVAGEGAETLSCCSKTGGNTYCRGHMKVMFRAPERVGKEFVKGVARWAA